jgi:hypothetical protein
MFAPKELVLDIYATAQRASPCRQTLLRTSGLAAESLEPQERTQEWREICRNLLMIDGATIASALLLYFAT